MVEAGMHAYAPGGAILEDSEMQVKTLETAARFA